MSDAPTSTVRETSDEAEFLINSDSLTVHKATCASTRPTRPGDGWWFMPWKPEQADKYDTPCRRCLPDGLPAPEVTT